MSTVFTTPRSPAARARISRGRQVGRIVVSLLATLGVVGCGVRADSVPRDVPAPMRDLISNGPVGNDAAGVDRIFLVAPGQERQLRSVQRDSVSIEDLMKILMAGPNQTELAEQYTTVIPPDTVVRSVRSQGSVLIVDLSDQLTELTGGNLMLAIAQIVYTASEINGVEAVQIEINGEPKAWQRANGVSTFAPLTTYDFADFVQSAQPAYPVQNQGQ